MPRTRQENERLVAEQRTKILNAAQRVLASKGARATMDEIAAEASISHGLTYRYFDSKEAIVRALVERALHAPSAELQHVRESPGTAGERLAQVITEFVASRRGHPEFYQLLDRVLHDQDMPQDFRKLIHQRGLALRNTLKRLIVEGQATGEVAKGDPDQLVSAILACFDGLTRSARDPKHHLKHFPDASIFLRMLKP